MEHGGKIEYGESSLRACGTQGCPMPGGGSWDIQHGRRLGRKTGTNCPHCGQPEHAVEMPRCSNCGTLVYEDSCFMCGQMRPNK